MATHHSAPLPSQSRGGDKGLAYTSDEPQPPLPVGLFVESPLLSLPLSHSIPVGLSAFLQLSHFDLLVGPPRALRPGMARRPPVCDRQYLTMSHDRAWATRPLIGSFHMSSH